ncbi:WSC domain-containing protein [Triangularia verruculosa]|uniref:WSC domain-containing protein n=1 Tax=Triangularia verruculosa TaxID=2587418 RepID=A0AAN6X6M2_9PEZI|nr:WSC domain-containing protein [Triangularia verruculosa]
MEQDPRSYPVAILAGGDAPELVHHQQTPAYVKSYEQQQPYYQNQYPQSHTVLDTEEASEPKEKRICGVRLSILFFITTGLLVLVIAALALVGGLLGSKISSLETSYPALASNVAAISGGNTNSGGTDGSNSNNPPADNNDNSGAGTSLPTQTISAPVTYSTNIAVEGYRYLGCYYDDTQRLLIDQPVKGNSSMTNLLCSRICSGFKYFGTEIGIDCYCGNRIEERAVSPKANEWDCSVKCPGNNRGRKEVCGGDWSISIWEKTD